MATPDTKTPGQHRLDGVLQRAPKAIQKGLEIYGSLSPIGKFALDTVFAAIAAKIVMGIELRHRLHVDKGGLQEINTEVASVKSVYDKHIKSGITPEQYVNALDAHYAESGTYQRVTTYLQQRESGTLKKTKTSDQQITSIATRQINTDVEDQIQTTAGLLAQIHHAETKISTVNSVLDTLHSTGAHSIFNLVGSELVVSELHLPAATRLGSTILRGAGSGLREAHKQSQAEIARITSNLLKNALLPKGLGETSTTENMVEDTDVRTLMEDLLKIGVIQQASDSTRRQPKWENGDVHPTLAAVAAYAVRRSVKVNGTNPIIKNADLAAYLAQLNIALKK